MAVKNFKQYVLDHTHPTSLYTFEPPEQSVLDLDFGMFEEDFSGNGHHLHTTNTYNPELARFSSGNPVFGLDHYLQSTAVIGANTGLYGKNPGLLYEFTVYGWFKPPTNTSGDQFIFGLRRGSAAPSWCIYTVNDEYIRARYRGTNYYLSQYPLIQGWNSLLVRKRYSYSGDKNYLEVFLNNVLIKTITADDYLLNPNQTFKLFSQKGQTSENGYSTPANDIALGCVAVWSRALTDDEINNLHQASTTGIDMPDAGGGGGIQIPGNGNTTTVTRLSSF
ncbi:LamG-like jellyroll fold domain-containing protein [Endozoicomonas sp. ALC013]|uniref:LamG-like jellyroll fold domain-containing protein n=1 Tax=Endozoicomonas sp. ALC013 TaxID=3403076 RepID=UPI003BB65C30